MSSDHESNVGELDSQDAHQISPRSPLYAVLFSLLMSGLGHIYCGRLTTGLVWAALGAFSGTVSLYALATQSISLASWLPMWLISIGSAAHAWWTAKHCPADYRLQSMNHWYVYALFLAIGSFGAAGHGVLMRTNVVQAFVTPVNDMNPTLQRGDRFLIDKTAYLESNVQQGDVIVFKDPETQRRSYVKRVHALAGDTLEVRDGIVSVNGKNSSDESPIPDVPDFGPTVIPPHNCFVLGDNLAKSKDSRHFGPIPYASVEGKVTNIFWPSKSWARLGRVR